AAAETAPSFPTKIATRVERAFRTPGASPNGLQATPEGLWILDQATNRVALVDYKDGHVIRQFDTDTDKGSGITFDGSALWRAATRHRLGPGRLPLVRREHLPVVLQNGSGHWQDSRPSHVAGRSANGRWLRPGAAWHDHLEPRVLVFGRGNRRSLPRAAAGVI